MEVKFVGNVSLIPFLSDSLFQLLIDLVNVSSG